MAYSLFPPFSLLFHTPHHQCLFPTKQFGIPPSLPKSKPFFAKLVDRTPTLDIVQSFPPTITLLPNVCPLYLAVVESIAHLFLHCWFTCRLWGQVLQLFNISCALPKRWFTLYISLCKLLAPYKKISHKLWIFCLHALRLAIWKERNCRVFDFILGHFSVVWDSFLFLVTSWSKTDWSLSCYSLESFRCNFRSILSSQRELLLIFVINKILFYW